MDLDCRLSIASQYIYWLDGGFVHILDQLLDGLIQNLTV